MILKQFHNLQLSLLGMGNMRLPTTGERGPIDEVKAQEIIDYVYQNGVNYYDTAYAYHGGESEKFIGQALSKYPRESWYLADKFWNNVLRPGQKVQDIFEEQLRRCNVDYFDFYLIHGVNDKSREEYINIDKTQGMFAYLETEKKAGRIKHLGFSCHSSTEGMVRFLDYYPKFEFVQIQLNYADWTLQDAKSKYEILTQRGIPVIVMELVRGGTLASLGEEVDARLKQERPDDSIASWAFRYLQSLPNVCVILSGMTTIEQAQDNILTFEEAKPLGSKEMDLLQEVVTPLLTQTPCTACRYCCDGDRCPQDLNIPRLLNLYNQYLFAKDYKVMLEIMTMSPEELPACCTACGECAKVCPQLIDVPGIMQTFTGVIEDLTQIVAKMFGPPKTK
jgi:predicted aldo/keto reductase-like oxidoreductase